MEQDGFIDGKFDPVEGSAPCRIDMGGTLDIRTFYLPLRFHDPCTVNIALDLRTTVRISPHPRPTVRITSRKIAAAEYMPQKAPFNHPLGLMFAVAAYYGAKGVHIRIDSSSPPRSALGGSSVAAVALIGAFEKLADAGKPLTASLRRKIARLAHRIEESVAGVPCGMQDQLAAAYGGVNVWHWPADRPEKMFDRESFSSRRLVKDFRRHFLVAYCGIPHESKHINDKWIREFLAGRRRDHWVKIIDCTKNFATALKSADYRAAAEAVNRETALRLAMTPEVLDALGRQLAKAAAEHRCGARFTGAGGGGCVWALGEADDIERLRFKWQALLSRQREACLLDAGVDEQGLG